MTLKEVSKILTKLSEGKDLTVREAEAAFDATISKDKEYYFFSNLMMGIMAKGATVEELLGFCRSEQKFIPIVDLNVDPKNITDNSGTGGDKLKTFNVSTTATFIIAAADIMVAKQSFYAVTGVGGSGDLFRELGIDVKETSNPKTIKNVINKVGIVPYVSGFVVPLEKRPGYGYFHKRAKIGLNYLTPYHLAANVLPAVKMERKVYGVFDNKYSEMLARLLQKLGYTKGMIVYGVGGLDEISTIGDTEIVEFTKRKVKKYKISPRDLGIKKAVYKDVKAVSAKQNVIDFLRILYNEEKGPKRDIVLVNAAASLYVVDKVKNLAEGVSMARQILENELASNKLEHLIATIGNEKKLVNWKKKAGLA